MSKNNKKRGFPKIVVLPTGQRYELTVLRVEEFREDGVTPDVVTVVYPDDMVELSQNVDQNHFITAYLPERTK